MEPIQLAQISACVFFAILFLQSSFDKVFDWKGNLDWLTGHFAKTPFKGVVPLLLGAVTVTELATGVTAAVSAVLLLIGGRTQLAVIAVGLGCLSLLMLFAGQRIAKDYPGAATLATYFCVALLSLFILSLGPK